MNSSPRGVGLSAAGSMLLAVLIGLVLGSGGARAQMLVAAPTIDIVSPADSALSVTWTAPAGVTGITAYDLHHIRSDAADKSEANWTVVEDIWTGSGDLVAFTLSGLDNRVGYDIQLRTVTDTDGAWSTTATGTPVIPAPTVDRTLAGDGAISLEWSAPATAATTNITAYDARYIESAATDKADANWTVEEGAWTHGALRAVLAGRTNGTGYDVQVRAVAGTDGAWSTTATTTPAEHGDTREEATTLPLDTQMGGTLQHDGDSDFFQFEVTEGTGIILYTRGDLDTAANLLDATGSPLATYDDGYLPHGVKNFLISRDFQPGTYYLEVVAAELALGAASSVGSYVLETQTVRDTARPADARPIELGGQLMGIADRARDQDFISFTLAEETVVVVRVASPARLRDDPRAPHPADGGFRSALLDAMFRPALQARDIELPLSDQAIRANLAPGTYYVLINGPSGDTAYMVSVVPAPEPGSAAAAAAPLVVHRATGGTISSATDADYFRFDLSEPTYVRIVAAGLEVSLSGELRDGDDNPIRANLSETESLSGGLPGFELRQRLEAGSYYVKVTPALGYEMGAYAILLDNDAQYADFIERCGRVATSVSDPLYACQWELNNTGQFGGTPGEDINIEAAWAITQGAGVNVVVVDDGMSVDHEDLSPNVVAERNRDYLGDDMVYRPPRDHGTSVAGIIVARDNDVGLRGVAPRASIHVHNVLQRRTPENLVDSVERDRDVTAVSSNSWGSGGGWAVAPSSWEGAVEEAVELGYGGKGVFYAFAAGNQGEGGDNANYDGFINHYAVAAVCAVDHHGIKAPYSEEGANLWICAPSYDYAAMPVGIVSTSLYNRYNPYFGGTSSATPTVSGVAALIRAANTTLTARDVKLILANTARQNDPAHAGWEVGAVKYHTTEPTRERYGFNHAYGFGVVDAGAAVTLADSGWTNLPPMRQIAVTRDDALEIPDLPSGGATPTSVSQTVTIDPYIGFVEFVHVEVTFDHSSVRHLEIELESPAGARSRLAVATGTVLPFRRSYRFGSARHLGEAGAGEWTLHLADHYPGHDGTLRSWRITLYGHGFSPGFPQIASAAPGGRKLTVDWDAPDDTGGSAITSYNLRYIRSNERDQADPLWTALEGVAVSDTDLYELTGLAPGIEYLVQVQAVNDSGPGPWSEAVFGTTPQEAPEPPGSIKTTPRDGELVVRWEEPAITGGPEILNYQLRYIETAAMDKSDVNWTASTIWVPEDGELRAIIPGLTSGVGYDLQLRAANSIGDGAWSATVTGTPAIANRPPAFPTDTESRSVLEDTPHGTSIGEPFRATDPEGDPLYYRVGRGGSAFRLDRLTGSLVTFEPLDHESTPTHTFDISVSDRKDPNGDADRAIDDAVHVTVTVENANEAPEISGPRTRTVLEQRERVQLTYRVTDPDGDTITWSLAGPDQDDFQISSSGVLSVPDELDFEAPADENGDNKYLVTLQASDGVATDTHDLTLRVVGLDEPPEVTGRSDVSYRENGAGPVAQYAASDPEGDTTTLSPRGPDRDAFEISDSGILTFRQPPDREAPHDANHDNVYEVTIHVAAGRQTDELQARITITDENEPPPSLTGEAAVAHDEHDDTPVARYTARDPEGITLGWSLSGADRDAFEIDDSGALSFLNTPDYEDPADANGDNVYDVTVRASDGPHALTRDVTVTVANIDEDGMIALPSIQPQAGTTLTATLSDPDGSTSAPAWQWQTSADRNNWSDIAGTTTARYTPLAGDAGAFLRVVASYTDGHGPRKTARAAPSAAVRPTPPANRAPAFPSQRDVRQVAENTTTEEAIGTPVVADDEDPLTYTLDRAGAAFFDIDERSGQLRTRTALDHEKRAAYEVTVTATDPSLAAHTITVTVAVTNVDEPPVLSGPAVATFAHQGADTVATYTAADPERDTITWDLSGNDSSLFHLDAGTLRFLALPDYTSPADTDANNIHELTITASDGTLGDSLNVYVTVVERTATSGTTPPIGPGGGGAGSGPPPGPTPSDEDFEWTVDRDIDELDGGHDKPSGLWSDGTTLWIADNRDGADDAIYAYDLKSGERVEEREFELAERNRAPRGIWSDRTVIWVSDSGQDKLFAHALASGERVPDSDLALHPDNDDPRGIWSDGETMWVLDGGKDSLFAYDLGSGELLAEYALDSANDDPHGIWSDRVAVWVSDHGAKRLFAYRLPAPEGPAAAGAEPQDLERVIDEEFKELSKASNNSPRGIWSDGDVMYVADESDAKVYSYNMPDAIDARLASLTLSGVDIGEFSSDTTEYAGVAAEGVTETTVEAQAAQPGASVSTEPPDTNAEAEGYQVALAGVAEIAITVTSADGSRERVYRVRLSEPELTFDCFRGDVAVGFSLVVYGGGSVEDLEACAESRHVTTLYALADGEYLSYTLGAPEFVNAPFGALVADGLPPLTPLTVKSDGPPTADPLPGSLEGVTSSWPTCLSGEVVEGFSLVLYEGGSVDGLEACARSLDVAAVYALHDGQYVSYILGAPEFVNRPFGELYADGVSALTPLVARSD